MTQPEMDAVIDGVAQAVADSFSKQIDGLMERIALLEQRQTVPGRDGRDGLPGVKGDRGDAGPQGHRGADATMPDIEDVVKRLAVLVPAGRDGKDGRDAVVPDVEEIAKAAAALVPEPVAGRDGQDADPAVIAAEVAKAIAALPAPKDGKDGRDGSDGVSVTTDDVAPMIDALVSKSIAALPVPKDGKDGRDGVTLDVNDLLTVEYDGEKTFTWVFKRGELEQRVPVHVPVPIYRGVWEDGKSYDAGDCTTWGGSMWVAKQATTAKPDLPTAESRVWTLCVKRGAPGKSGSEGKAGPIGPRGEKGDKGPERW